MRYAVGVHPWVPLRDRFVTAGYQPDRKLTVFEMIERASMVEGADGIELRYPTNIDEDNSDKVISALRAAGLALPDGIAVPVSGDPMWGRGSLTAREPAARTAAMERVMRAMDMCARFGLSRVNLWTGQDGYDYPLEVDYEQSYGRLVSAIRECADHNPKIKIALEYKPNEPRKRIFNGTIGKALFLVHEVDRPNVGILLDFGHAAYARENPAESVYLAARANRLYHVHVNDNYGVDDDDLSAGAVHFTEFIDFVYWLKRIKYDGWLALDVYPVRENGEKAAQNTIFFMRKIESFVESIGVEVITELLRRGEVADMYEMIWKKLF